MLENRNYKKNTSFYSRNSGTENNRNGLPTRNAQNYQDKYSSENTNFNKQNKNYREYSNSNTPNSEWQQNRERRNFSARNDDNRQTRNWQDHNYHNRHNFQVQTPNRRGVDRNENKPSEGYRKKSTYQNQENKPRTNYNVNTIEVDSQSQKGRSQENIREPTNTEMHRNYYNTKLVEENDSEN